MRAWIATVRIYASCPPDVGTHACVMKGSMMTVRAIVWPSVSSTSHMTSVPFQFNVFKNSLPRICGKYFAEEKLLVATSRDLYAIGLSNGLVRMQEIRDHSEYDIRGVAFDIRNQFVFSATTVGEHTRIKRRYFDSREVAKIVLNLENPGVKNSHGTTFF